MYNFPIGVILESFKLPRSEAIRKAAELGANGIQMYATSGESSPESLDASARKALKKQVNSRLLRRKRCYFLSCAKESSQRSALFVRIELPRKCDIKR